MTLADGHQSIVRSDVCAVSVVRRVAAMLDLESSRFVEGDMLPRGWHFFLLGGEAPRSDLRADGFSGFGVPIPDLGLPRLLIAGRTVAYHSDIPIGANLVRSSVIDKIEHKTVPS
ncbi:MAG: hypothetical protein HOO99_12810, partial [Hyphomicrobiaceae bacterium]|nr:hypothetical protein [Hyphomicrobiaceae bacterium]